MKQEQYLDKVRKVTVMKDAEELPTSPLKAFRLEYRIPDIVYKFIIFQGAHSEYEAKQQVLAFYKGSEVTRCEAVDESWDAFKKVLGSEG